MLQLRRFAKEGTVNRTLCLFVGLFMMVAVTEVQSRRQPVDAESPLALAIQVGSAEIVGGPSTLADNAYNTLQQSNQLIAYVGNATTQAYVGGSLETLRPLSEPVIAPGIASVFDSCGAWLNGAWSNSGVVYGWYHAEENCNYPATDKSVAFAVSNDGGMTFSKAGYPNNQVLTAPFTTNPDANDEGDHKIVQVGNYLYMYFVAGRDFQVRVARSPIADGGQPGTWTKYYEGDFSQPGLGGESTRLDPTGLLARSWVTHNEYLNQYMGFSYEPNPDVEGLQGGYGLTFSPNGIDGWTSIDGPLVTYQRAYWDEELRGDLIDYPSALSVYGDSNRVGQDFWLYYMHIESGENFDSRYLVRRRVRIGQTAADDVARNRPIIALNHYQKGTDDRYTTTNVDPAYEDLGTLGYLFTKHIEDVTVPIYDCYIPFWDDHMLVPGDGTCDGAENKRRVGYIATYELPNSTAVYRCWDAIAENHFLSTDQACAGAEYEWRLGYLLNGDLFNENGFVALSDYTNDTLVDSWTTTILPDASYQFEQRWGYLFASLPDHAVPVYDCFIPFWDDHMMVIEDSTCGGGDVEVLGLLGYLSSEPFEGGVPIYRCFDDVTDNHFIWPDETCDGYDFEWRAGYISTVPRTVTPSVSVYLPVVQK